MGSIARDFDATCLQEVEARAGEMDVAREAQVVVEGDLAAFSCS